jgi:hypothetical protein
MSLLDLRDRHIIPAIDEQEVKLGHLLHSSLDHSDEAGTMMIEELQKNIAGLVSLRDFINQNRHHPNDTEYLKQYYGEAKRFGLDVQYLERKAIVVGVETKKTKLQERRSKKEDQPVGQEAKDKPIKIKGKIKTIKSEKVADR